ncbi:MAG: hypothetical protein ACRENE_20185 [Polyangiaceae bacterium]
MSIFGLRSGFIVASLGALGCAGCGGNVGTSSGSDASMGGPGQTQDDSGSSACSVSNPCPAGDAGCPVGLLPYPGDGDPCIQPGLGCYGYGSFSCPLMLACLANRTWQVSCPEHPFGTDSGSCGCSHVIPSDRDGSPGGSAQDGSVAGSDAGSDAAGGGGGPGCPNQVPLGCSCPTTYDGGVCVCSCFSMPECPAEVLSSQPVACDRAPSCMNCIGGVAGVMCSCIASGDGGSYWQCLGTEQSCTGGTFHG